MRSTSALVDGFGSGDPLPPSVINNLVDIAISAGDDSLFDFIALDPPVSASPTVVSVGFIPLHDGYAVLGDAAARQVTVRPLRALRSATSVSTPRAMVSAASEINTVVAQPAVAGAGLWGLDLLFARLQLVDASNPSKGLTITFMFATPASYLTTAGPPGIAALPAHTSSSWNVPIAYVKNVDGATTVPQAYILDIPAGIASSSNFGNLRHRLQPARARRAFAAGNNTLAALVSGGASAFASAANLLSSTSTPAVLGRQGLDFEIREILLPPEITGGSSGAVTHVTVDSTRDWRGANFVSLWSLSGAGGASGARFGEDDPSLGSTVTVQPVQFDGAATGGASALFYSVGQSHVATNPNGTFSSFAGGSALWAANLGFDVSNAPCNGIAQMIPTGDVFGLSVDAASGVLKFSRKKSGTTVGRATYVVVLAFFSRAR